MPLSCEISPWAPGDENTNTFSHCKNLSLLGGLGSLGNIWVCWVASSGVNSSTEQHDPFYVDFWWKNILALLPLSPWQRTWVGTASRKGLYKLKCLVQKGKRRLRLSPWLVGKQWKQPACWEDLPGEILTARRGHFWIVVFRKLSVHFCLDHPASPRKSEIC